VTLVGIRTEVSRHFKEIIALGFGTCRLRCPAVPGDLKGMINKFNIALGQSNAMVPTYEMVDQEYIKVPLDK
jgi:hypothetical protein